MLWSRPKHYSEVQRRAQRGLYTGSDLAGGAAPPSRRAASALQRCPRTTLNIWFRTTSSNRVNRLVLFLVSALIIVYAGHCVVASLQMHAPMILVCASQRGRERERDALACHLVCREGGAPRAGRREGGGGGARHAEGETHGGRTVEAEFSWRVALRECRVSGRLAAQTGVGWAGCTPCECLTLLCAKTSNCPLGLAARRIMPHSQRARLTGCCAQGLVLVRGGRAGGGPHLGLALVREGPIHTPSLHAPCWPQVLCMCVCTWAIALNRASPATGLRTGDEYSSVISVLGSASLGHPADR